MAKSVGKSSIWDGIGSEDKTTTTHTDVHTHTHNHVDSDVYAVKKTIKDKRIQILTYDDLIRDMDAYAKRKGLSRAEVFEKAVSEFLDRNR